MICGRTGSGKTSILNILFNLYPIQGGEIIINGNNILEYKKEEIIKIMSIIP